MNQQPILNLLNRRQHVMTYDTEDIPEKQLIEDLLWKAWKVTPSKNNFMPYHCNVLGPDKVEEKRKIWLKSVKNSKDINEKETTFKSKVGVEINPYFEHIKSSPYLLVFTQRLGVPNEYYKTSIKQGLFFEQMHSSQLKIVFPDASLEVGMWMANLSAFALEKDLHTSVLKCYPHEYKEWSDLPWVKHPVILLASIGKAKKFRRESMNEARKKQDKKPEPETIIKWI